MKRLVPLVLALLCLSGCEKALLPWNDSKVVHTGCNAGATRSHAGGEEHPEYIYLKYSLSGLVLIHEWGDYNCAIKNCELQRKLEINESDITLHFWTEISANCVCPVKKVQTLIEGLHTGKEYTLHFNGLNPIQFKYSTNLNLKLKAEDYEQW